MKKKKKKKKRRAHGFRVDTGFVGVEREAATLKSEEMGSNLCFPRLPCLGTALGPQGTSTSVAAQKSD